MTKHFGTGPQFDSKWELRPEIRTEKAFRAGIPPYQNGTKGFQTTFGVDALMFFRKSVRKRLDYSLVTPPKSPRTG